MYITDFEIEERGPIVIFKSPDHELHNKAFVRIQEFYESTFPQIKGKYFTLAAYKKLYTKQTGGWTYYTDWHGHNIDGKTIRAFYDTFPVAKLDDFEASLLAWLIGHGYGQTEKFCIIACKADDQPTLNHELAHAFWYLYPAYKKQMLKMMATSKKSSRMFSDLYNNLEKDYTAEAIDDEMHAYTAAMRDMHEFCVGCEVRPYNVDVNAIIDMQYLFKKYMTQYGFST